jgi:hypothetical protein
VTVNPRLLRQGRRRSFRRLVFLCALVGLFLFAPAAVATPPEITVTIAGTLGQNGWYRSNVTVNWQVEGETTSSGCDTVTLNADTPGTKITCTADSDGDQTSKSITIKLDKVPPAIAAAPERLPDANGWYNRPLTVFWSGTDATSGIEPCSSAQYAGPDNAAALVPGSCRDLAGNVATTSFAVKYDATAPSLLAVTAQVGNRSAQVGWQKSTDTRVIEVLRAPGRSGQGETVVYRGSESGYRDTGLVVGRKYQYRVIGVDEAANRAERKVEVVATGALLSPAPAERVSSPPNLTWTPVKGARYYNVQLVRGRKVLSAWPVRPGFQLRRTWVYKGVRHRLRPGVYRWYVWPGRGRRSVGRYGNLLGSSTFVVTE